MAENKANRHAPIEIFRGILPKGPILEPQRQVVVDFLKPKVEFINSNLSPVRPYLEKLGSQVTTYVGAVMAVDGWRNLDPYVLSQRPLDEFALSSAGLSVLEALVGAGIVVVADHWKRSIWHRETKIHPR